MDEMTPAAALALFAAWFAAGLLVARCCGLNQRLDPRPEPRPMPLTPADITEAADHAAGAIARIETISLALLSGEITQVEAHAELARAYADRDEYLRLQDTYVATLITQPPYYPGSIKAAPLDERRISRRTCIVHPEA